MGAAILECKPYIVLTISAIIISGKIFLGMYINVHKYVYINYHLWKIYGKFMENLVQHPSLHHGFTPSLHIIVQHSLSSV